MKRLVAILSLFTILLCGCVSSQGNDPVGQQMRKMIREDFSVFENHDFTGGTDQDLRYVCGMRYYGTYNGYIVLFDSGPLCVMSEERIGKKVFYHGSNFNIYAYKDREFLLLKDIYEQGLISASELATIAQIHMEFQE